MNTDFYAGNRRNYEGRRESKTVALNGIKYLNHKLRVAHRVTIIAVFVKVRRRDDINKEATRGIAEVVTYLPH